MRRSIAHYKALPKASFKDREAIYLSKSMLLQPLKQPEAVCLMMPSSLIFCQPQPEKRAQDVQRMSKKTAGLQREQAMDFAVCSGNSFAEPLMQCRHSASAFIIVTLFSTVTYPVFWE